MCNRYRGPSIDALYQDLIHLAKQFQRRFKKIDQSKSRIAFGVLFINGSGQNKQPSQRTLCRCFLPRFSSFGQEIAEKIFSKSTNQKRIACGVHVFFLKLRRNVQSLQRTFHRCFLPRFSSFGQEIAENIFQNPTNQNQELPLAVMFIVFVVFYYFL